MLMSEPIRYRVMVLTAFKYELELLGQSRSAFHKSAYVDSSRCEAAPPPDVRRGYAAPYATYFFAGLRPSSGLWPKAFSVCHFSCVVSILRPKVAVMKNEK